MSVSRNIRILPLRPSRRIAVHSYNSIMQTSERFSRSRSAKSSRADASESIRLISTYKQTSMEGTHWNESKIGGPKGTGTIFHYHLDGRGPLL